MVNPVFAVNPGHPEQTVLEANVASLDLPDQRVQSVHKDQRVHGAYQESLVHVEKQAQQVSLVEMASVDNLDQ